MCGRFTLRQRLNRELQEFAVEAQADWDYPQRYNIAPSQEIPVIRQTGPKRELRLMRRGLIPSWATDPKIGYSMINARSETAAEKNSFKNALKKRRCLIPADGFYEWQKVGNQKQPILFCRPDEKVFAFAGLWEQWNKGDKPIESCTILTTSANDLVKPLHDRMPVILSPNDYGVWLNPETTDPATPAYLFEPIPADELTAYPVNPVVNNARHEGADCVERVAG